MRFPFLLCCFIGMLSRRSFLFAVEHDLNDLSIGILHTAAGQRAHSGDGFRAAESGMKLLSQHPYTVRKYLVVPNFMLLYFYSPRGLFILTHFLAFLNPFRCFHPGLSTAIHKSHKI